MAIFEAILRRGYDIHLHYANFGIRKLSLRLPLGLSLPDDELANYAGGDVVSWQVDSSGTAGTLTISPDIEAGDMEELWELDEFLDRLLGIRQQLMDGDFRALYVGSLCAGQMGLINADLDIEPPVPAGLVDAPAEIVAMLELFEIDRQILTAAKKNRHR
ncbi:MAG: hypothetical protein ACI9NC_000996 [Verrucomicrobiales bacterium]|jgi:hypothetical protein